MAEESTAIAVRGWYNLLFSEQQKKAQSVGHVKTPVICLILCILTTICKLKDYSSRDDLM